MASAIPVPGQPGRLFVPGRMRSRMPRARTTYETKKVTVDEGHMTISEVSTQDLEDYERDHINGLGATAPTSKAVVKTVSPPYPWRQSSPVAKGDDIALLQTLLIAVGWPLGGRSGVYGPRTAAAVAALLLRAKYRGDRKQFDAAASDAIKALGKDNMKPTDAEAKQVAGMLSDEAWASSLRTDLVLDGGPSTNPAATEPTGGGFAALLKSPWYWVGVAAVAGVGLWWLMKRRAPVSQVAAVETLSLEGVKPKRRKSRRKPKSKA